MFAFDGSDVVAYPTLPEAERRTGVYALGRLVFFADDGALLIAHQEGPRVRLVPSDQRDRADLNRRLVTYLGQPKVGLDTALATEPLTAAREISRRQWESRICKRPSWLDRRLNGLGPLMPVLSEPSRQR